jgi:hypothetical protein
MAATHLLGRVPRSRVLLRPGDPPNDDQEVFNLLAGGRRCKPIVPLVAGLSSLVVVEDPTEDGRRIGRRPEGVALIDACRVLAEDQPDLQSRGAAVVRRVTLPC